MKIINLFADFLFFQSFVEFVSDFDIIYQFK